MNVIYQRTMSTVEEVRKSKEEAAQNIEMEWQRVWHASEDEHLSLDPALHTVEGRIFELQNVIERHLSFASNESWGDKKQHVWGKTWNYSSFSKLTSQELQRLVLLLRNQLIFEQFLRQTKTKSIIASKNRNVRELEELHSENALLNSRLEQQKNAEGELRELTESQRKEINELREQNSKIMAKFKTKLMSFGQTNQALEEKVHSLKTQNESLTEAISTVKTELNQKDDEIFQLELKIKVLTTKLDQQETTKQKNMLVQDQFIAWEQQGKQLARCHKTINQLKDKVEFGETTIASLTEQIEELQNKNSVLDSKLDESRDRVAHIEEYKEDLQGKVLQLKQILEQQKQISVTKIKYIEDKYQNIKEINVGLEKYLLQIQAELEKYKAVTKLTSSSDGTVVNSNSSSK
jgi:myosin heavy subunit